MALPDWQLPPGVDRGLWDYLHSEEMVAGYDRQMAESPLAAADVSFCETTFPTPGTLIDLGCGTGRLAIHFARRGYTCTGVDLSEVMLQQARANAEQAGIKVTWLTANLLDLSAIPAGSFDYAACLFSTLGMIRGDEQRQTALRQFARLLKPGGRLVVHVHNRWFRILGWRRFRSADLTMPQAYGGAPLTLHHFTRGEITRMLTAAGFTVTDTRTLNRDSRLGTLPWFGSGSIYGYLLSAELKATAPGLS